MIEQEGDYDYAFNIMSIFAGIIWLLAIVLQIFGLILIVLLIRLSLLLIRKYKREEEER